MDEGGFRKIIQNILNRWSGLKLSVEHQSGGRQSKEKAVYLIDYIHEVLVSNSRLDVEDLEGFITEYMDSELRTILEDDSVREISRVLLRFYEMHQTGRQGDLLQELESLPRCENWLDICVPKITVEDGSDESESSENETENKLETMDCEWTTITYKKSRR